MYGPGMPFFDIFSLLIPVLLFLGALYVAFAIFQGRSSRDGDEAPDVTSSVLRVVYTLALAGLIAAFVGFGIEVIYPSPQYPGEEDFYGGGYGGGMTVEGGATMGSTDGAIVQEGPPDVFTEPGMSPEMIESERAYMQQERVYQRELSEHHRIASLIATCAAAFILLAGLIPGLRNLPVIGDGLTLGGLLTLVYGLVLGVQVDNNLFRFLTIAAGLVVLLVTISLKLRSGDLRNA